MVIPDEFMIFEFSMEFPKNKNNPIITIEIMIIITDLRV